MKSDALHGEVTASHSVFGAPCWASLTTRDLRAAEDFYRSVLGWEWRTSSTVGDQYRVASVHGVPVAGVSEVHFGVNTAIVWTPYFAVASADESVSRSQEGGPRRRGRAASVGRGSLVAFAVTRAASAKVLVTARSRPARRARACA
ncbi:VOC family protein [Streptomyces mirabilis]|uniref:hypothetical protein n=1 Tax=Streptomyces mirabilis TaxID=68239 RepID=UPI00364D4A2B